MFDIEGLPEGFDGLYKVCDKGCHVVSVRSGRCLKKRNNHVRIIDRYGMTRMSIHVPSVAKTRTKFPNKKLLLFLVAFLICVITFATRENFSCDHIGGRCDHLNLFSDSYSSFYRSSSQLYLTLFSRIRETSSTWITMVQRRLTRTPSGLT